MKLDGMQFHSEAYQIGPLTPNLPMYVSSNPYSVILLNRSSVNKQINKCTTCMEVQGDVVHVELVPMSTCNLLTVARVSD